MTSSNILEVYSDKEKDEIQGIHNLVSGNTTSIKPYIDLYDTLNSISSIIGILQAKKIFNVSTSDLFNMQSLILLKALEVSNIYRKASAHIIANQLFSENKDIFLEIASNTGIVLDDNEIIKSIELSLSRMDDLDLDPEEHRKGKPLEIIYANGKLYVNDGKEWIELRNIKLVNEVKKNISKFDALRKNMKGIVKEVLKVYSDAFTKFFRKTFKMDPSRVIPNIKKSFTNNLAYESVIYNGFIYEAINKDNLDLEIASIVAEIEDINPLKLTNDRVVSYNLSLRNKLSDLEKLNT